MPGRFFLTRPISEIAAALDVPNSIAEQPPRRNIQPGQEVIVLTASGLTPMRWGMIPVGRVNEIGRAHV